MSTKKTNGKLNTKKITIMPLKQNAIVTPDDDAHVKQLIGDVSYSAIKRPSNKFGKSEILDHNGKWSEGEHMACFAMFYGHSDVDVEYSPRPGTTVKVTKGNIAGSKGKVCKVDLAIKGVGKWQLNGQCLSHQVLGIIFGHGSDSLHRHFTAGNTLGGTRPNLVKTPEDLRAWYDSQVNALGIAKHNAVVSLARAGYFATHDDKQKRDLVQALAVAPTDKKNKGTVVGKLAKKLNK